MRLDTRTVLVAVFAMVCVPAWGGSLDLHKAAALNRPDDVKSLCAEGFAPNAPDRHGRTAMHYAVLPKVQGNDHSLSIVEALLNHGGDPNFVDSVGLAPIDLAVMVAPVGVVRMMLENGGNPNRILPEDYEGISLLAVSKIYGRADTATLLEEFGAVYGVSPREQEYIPHLDTVLEFATLLRTERERMPGISVSAQYSELVRRLAQKAWKGELSESGLDSLAATAEIEAQKNLARTNARLKRLETSK